MRPGQPAEIVIIAVSGRALAQSAAKTGCRVRVLDAFADRDTRAAAEAVCVAADAAIALDPVGLFAALGELGEPTERVIVVGSGFERTPELLLRLAAYGSLCANDASVVAATKKPELAMELLRALGWQVPDTQCAPPADPRGWLQKEIGGAGGVHVRRAEVATAHARTYYQRELPGCPMSVTFLADVERAYVLGFNAQSFHAKGDAPFCYSGASTCTVEPALASDMQARLDRLVRGMGLRGLNGLDFLLADGGASVLELNPRPTATFELYEDDFPEGLVHWHIRSFSGPVPELAARLAQRHPGSRAYAVLYAEDNMTIPVTGAFPRWCRDLPLAGSTIARGAPVLSVFAEGETAAHAARVLQERCSQARHMLAGLMTDVAAEMR